MAKSFFERLARELGKTTGRLKQKAKEKGLDEKAGAIASKARAALGDLVREFETGREEAGVDAAEREKDPAAGEPSSSTAAADETSGGAGIEDAAAGDELTPDEVAAREGAEREDVEPDGENDPGDTRADAPSGR